MPPKVKITKEAIVSAAVDIVRKEGARALNARTVAAALACSTQPIFSHFATMEQLHRAVVQQGYQLYGQYTQQEIASGRYPAYKSSGMAYIRFAREEKELFKLLFMHRPSRETQESDGLYQQMTDLVQSNTGLSGEEAQLFHLEIWAVVHGIATMFATGFLDLPWELVSQMLTDTYQGLRKQYEME